MAKFIIKRRQEAADYIWILETDDGQWLCHSYISFETEEETRDHIKLVKKACTKYTKVEVITSSTDNILI